jgi:hypothetical protein
VRRSDCYYERQPPESRLVLIKNAMDSGDAETVSAILSAPRILNLASDLTRNTVETAMAQSAASGKFRALADLKSAVAIVTNTLARLQSYVRSDSGATCRTLAGG